MATLYPNLSERIKSEGLCPICLMEMELAPRYNCDNGHTICYRCKPYYYACPICQSSLEMEMPTSNPDASYAPPPSHFIPHSLPPNFCEHDPSAPSRHDFLDHERNCTGETENAYNAFSPLADQELQSCLYADLGCGVKLPKSLVDLHESRCQYRPDISPCLAECKYHVVGCKVKTPHSDISIHENHCDYRHRFETLQNISESFDQIRVTDEEYDNQEELVECKYRKYGCMVNMPRRRKEMHQQKCNYSKYEQEESSSEGEYDPDEQVTCKWAEYGCRVRPKRNRAEAHEEKCNYRMEECAFKENGCDTLFHPARKYAHEKSCPFAN